MGPRRGDDTDGWVIIGRCCSAAEKLGIVGRCDLCAASVVFIGRTFCYRTQRGEALYEAAAMKFVMPKIVQV